MDVKCTRTAAILTRKEPLTAGMAKAVQLKLMLSQEWKGLQKIAVFKSTPDGTQIDVEEGLWPEENVCFVPSEVAETANKHVFFGLYGVDAEKNVIIPTVWCDLGYVNEAPNPDGGQGADPTLPFWAQIKRLIENIKEPDTTLTIPGRAADAKATGAALTAATDARAELRARILQTASAVTPLLLTADAIDDNPGTVLMPDGSTAATASAIGASDAYACRPGQTLAYTLSTQGGRLVLAVYDAAGNLTHGVEGGGYGAYITGEYTFGANDAYFRVGGVTGGNYRKNYALSYSYGLPNAATRADLAAVEAEMEALRGRALPPYWETYLQEKAGQIREAVRAVGNHGVVFQFFTDFHRPQSDVNYRGYTTLPQLLAYVKKHCFVDDVVFGGDVLQKNATAEEAAAVLEQYVQEFAELKPLNIAGNHDGNRYGGDPAGSAPVGADTLYSILFRGMEGRVRMGPGLYWYRDNETQKVRVIALNTGMDALSEWNADAAQHSWLVDTLAGTPNGYTLIVIPHVFFQLSGGALALSTIGSSVKAVVDAYATRSSGTWQGVSYDFTHAGGTVACILCGHTHNDGVIVSEAGYPMIGTVCEAMWGSQQTIARGTQAKQTTNEHAFDVVCLDTGSKTIKCVRVGSGADRTFSYPADPAPVPEQETVEVTIPDSGNVFTTIEAGRIYHFTGDLISLELELNPPASGELRQYHFDFMVGDTPPDLTFTEGLIPTAVIMPDGFELEANKRYEIDILNGHGVVQEWTE